MLCAFVDRQLVVGMWPANPFAEVTHPLWPRRCFNARYCPASGRHRMSQQTSTLQSSKFPMHECTLTVPTSCMCTIRACATNMAHGVCYSAPEQCQARTHNEHIRSLQTSSGEAATQEEEQPIDWFITSLLFLFPALGGLLFGYDIGATSGAIISLKSAATSGTTWYALIADVHTSNAPHQVSSLRSATCSHARWEHQSQMARDIDMGASLWLRGPSKADRTSAGSVARRREANTYRSGVIHRSMSLCMLECLQVCIRDSKCLHQGAKRLRRRLSTAGSLKSVAAALLPLPFSSVA